MLVDFSNHVLVRKGRAEGRAEEREEGRAEVKYILIKDLILQTDFSNFQIAKLTRVSDDFVEKIRLEINSKL